MTRGCDRWSNGGGLLEIGGWVRMRALQFMGLATIAMATNAAAEGVTYDVSFPEASNHYAEVRARFEAPAGGCDVVLPAWTPGSYLVREYARHLDEVRAENDAGEALAVEKRGKDRWRIATEEAGATTVLYRLYCRELTVRTNWVEEEFALLNGAATFLTPEHARDDVHELRLHPAEGWPQSVCALPRMEGTAHGYRATDYDELVDSPIVLGDLELFPFEAGERDHVLVNVGTGGYWDGAQAAADVARIVEEHQRMWGFSPYERYLFLNIAAESRGGLEHDHSTVLMTSRWAYRDPKAYRSWLGLASHEFFHTWNVRRLRPRALMKYDYGREMFFRELWIAEGVTSYYDDLALVRCGLIDREEYLELLSKQIETLQGTPGRGVQSLRDASHDAWIKFYRPDENSGNTRVSYYNKGAVAAFLLDAEVRRASGGEASLDDVMRVLYERFIETGYDEDDFRAAAEEVAGGGLGDWFAAAIDGTRELEYGPALDWLGLQFAVEEGKTERRRGWA